MIIILSSADQGVPRVPARRHLPAGAADARPRARASSSSSPSSTGWCGSTCAPSPSTCRPRRSSPRTTCRPRSTPWPTSGWSTPPRRWSRCRTSSSATSQIAQTTLRSVLGQSDLDHLLTERDKLNARLQEIIDEQTEPWGVKVSIVEIKDVEIPAEHAAGHGPPGRSRAGAAGQGHRRRGRVPGLGEARPGRRGAVAGTRPPSSCATCRPWPRSPPRRTPPPSSRSPSTS